MKKVSFIIPTLRDGGAERVLSNMSINLDDSIDQSILVWDGDGIDYPYKGKLVNLNLVAYDKNAFGKLIKFFQRVKAVRKYKRENNIEVTISHLEGPNMVNIFSNVGDKVIICVHNFQSKELRGIRGRFNKFLMNKFYNKADLIIAVSENIKIDLVNKFNIKEEKIKVIYNPFDISRIEGMMAEELDEEHKKIFEKPVIINVGRLTNQKAQWHLIKAFSRIIEEKDDYNLVILGQGELESELKNLVKKFGIEKNVFFLGFQNNPFKFINRAEVFALTSLYEGFPMCLAESLCCGTATISVDCKSGPREMLAPDTNILDESKDLEFAKYGVLVPGFNDDFKNISNTDLIREEVLLANGIKKLLTDEALRNNYEVNGKKRVRKFDVSEILNEWKEII